MFIITFDFVDVREMLLFEVLFEPKEQEEVTGSLVR